jgi:hypothetical protein
MSNYIVISENLEEYRLAFQIASHQFINSNKTLQLSNGESLEVMSFDTDRYFGLLEEEIGTIDFLRIQKQGKLSPMPHWNDSRLYQNRRRLSTFWQIIQSPTSRYYLVVLSFAEMHLDNYWIDLDGVWELSSNNIV